MSSPAPTVLRLGTRGSLLARTQSQLVANALEKAHPGVHVELVVLRTSGDQITDRPLHDVGGKGLFTRELEQALLAGQIDFAVHSFKDVPVTMPLVDPSGLMIAAVPEREDSRDVLASDVPRRIDELPPGAKVGTGSLRRRCQLLELRPDLIVVPIRGNIDTRLRKLKEGQYDAVVLAAAGLKRAGLFEDSCMSMIDADTFLPAPGQGALAVQCRRGDERTSEMLAALNDAESAECVKAERDVVAELEGDCHSPIAALATLSGGNIVLRAAVGARGGGLPVLRASAQAPRDRATETVAAVMETLVKQGVREALHG